MPDNAQVVIPVAPAAVPAEFEELKDIEVFEFPCVDNRGRTWPAETADALLASQAEFGDRVKPPLVPGHSEKAMSVKLNGLPALGWGTDWRGVATATGKKIVATLSNVPKGVADLFRAGAYRRLSGSFWPDGAAANIPEAKGRPVIRHIAMLGAMMPSVKTLADVAALFGTAPVPAVELAEADDADVAEFQEAPAVAAEPTTLKEAVQEAVATGTTETPISKAIRALRNRLWVIDDTAKTDAEKAGALLAMCGELGSFLVAYKPAPTPQPDPVVAAAAQMSEPAAAAAVVTVTAPPAAAGGLSDPAEMSDADKQVVEVFLTRATAEGRLKPKHHPALRAQAAACFAQGGAEAVASFVDDENERRGAKVLALGETAPAAGIPPAAAGGLSGPAEMSDADPSAVAEAEAEFDRHNIGKALHITKAEYVKARTARK